MQYRITDDRNELPVQDVARLLKTTYWAGHRSPEQIERSMENSDCYGLYVEGEAQLVGFARVITDRATTYYLCDVVIDERYRHRGLGTALLSHIESLPEYACLRGILMTRDAHTLYQRFGYTSADGRAMAKSPRP